MSSRRSIGFVFWKRCVVSLVLIAGASSSFAWSEDDTPSIESRIERLARPYLENKIVHGMMIGVISGDERHAVGFGALSQENPAKPDGDTIYEIGSVTKTLTGVLLGAAVARGETKLDQPLADLLPEGIRAPSQGDEPIRLVHLSTHTSGLPRLPDNLKPADGENPYADYTVESMYEFINRHELRREPNRESEYSNLAVGLLGQVLASKAGVDYETLLAERLTGPLGMSATGIALTPEMKERLAPPHLADGSPTKNWDIPALAGAGAVRSSANDMLKLLAAHLHPPEGELGRAIEMAWEVHHRPKDPKGFSMGLGWHVARDGRTRWHNGQTGGYHSMVLVHREPDAAVVLLANTASSEVDRLAEDVIRLLLGAKVEPREFDKPLAVAAEVMDRYVGRYELAPNFIFTVTRRDDQLIVQATGQPALRVFPKSDTEWFYKVVEAKIVFRVDDKGVCNELVLHQNGRELPAKRLVEKDE